MVVAGTLRPRSSMQQPQVHARVRTTDEERGKRDDDFKPKIHHTRASSSSYLPWKWRKRRVALAILAIFLVYEFITNIPTDLGSIDQRAGRPLRPGHVVSLTTTEAVVGLPSIPATTNSFREPTGPPSRDPGMVDEEAEKHHYSGKIRFYRLSESLRVIEKMYGLKGSNRNILFAASSLKSTASLLPMACAMAKVDRNYVHFALFGRDTLSMDDVLRINTVNTETCKVIFHDARPDYTEYSSDARAEHATLGAMKHITDNVHPRAVIMDDSKLEDVFFVRGMRSSAKSYFHTIIEIPAGKYEEFLWTTRLDAGSLAGWFTPTIDIVIHAPHDNIGSLTRLLRSLQRADFIGLKMPRLTIELTAKVPSSLRSFLNNFRWPPLSLSDPSPVQQNLLTLHHRIPSARMSSEQASLRFVESFYPSGSGDHHVLILSPQAEVSPLFFQYLHFLLLEYRYSSWGAGVSQDLLGISLDVPSTFINGKGKFTPPVAADMSTKNGNIDQDARVQFLHQAPSSTASLIFSDRWVQFHDFLAKRLQASHSGIAAKTVKHVAETEPAWVEYLLELARARGWSMLQPASPLVTIHNELKEIPEEYLRPAKDSILQPAVENGAEEPFLLAAAPPSLPDPLNRELDASANLAPLHQLLPFEGRLPSLQDLPYLSHEGGQITLAEAFGKKMDFLTFFRATTGGCTVERASLPRLVVEGTTDDLFCLDDWEATVDGPVPAPAAAAAAAAAASK